MPGDGGDVGEAVGGVVPDAEPVGLGDVGVGLDGVAVVDALRRNAGAEGLPDLLRARRVGPAAQCGEAAEHLVDRAGFQGEPHGGAGQFLPQAGVGVLDAGEVEDDPVVPDLREGGEQRVVVRHRCQAGCCRRRLGSVSRAAATSAGHASVSSAKSSMSRRASSMQPFPAGRQQVGERGVSAAEPAVDAVDDVQALHVLRGVEPAALPEQFGDRAGPDPLTAVEERLAGLLHPVVDVVQVEHRQEELREPQLVGHEALVGPALRGVVVDDVPVVQHSGQRGVVHQVDEEVVAADGVGGRQQRHRLVHAVEGDVAHVDPHRVHQGERGAVGGEGLVAGAAEGLVDQLPLAVGGPVKGAHRPTTS